MSNPNPINTELISLAASLGQSEVVVAIPTQFDDEEGEAAIYDVKVIQLLDMTGRQTVERASDLRVASTRESVSRELLRNTLRQIARQQLPVLELHRIKTAHGHLYQWRQDGGEQKMSAMFHSI